MEAYEINFDGLVGLTHNYSGLSLGNIASMENISRVSNPKAAAKQGLRKMKFLHDLGIKQGVLLPHERPDVFTLRNLGSSGTDEEVIRQASQQSPELFSACCSASSMWTANAATISPSSDTKDGRVHITPANLVNKFHRSIEAVTTSRILKGIFTSKKHFKHHDPLPTCEAIGDEGAANHTRFCDEYGNEGVEYFVYGRRAFNHKGRLSNRFPARQTFEASAAVARLHMLSTQKVVFAQQNPETIDAGVFHNDVIAVGNQNVLFYHEKAFVNTKQILDEIKMKYGKKQFYFIEVKNHQVSLTETIKSYLFNSQLVTTQKGQMMIIVPDECEKTKTTWHYLQDLIQQETPVKKIASFDLRQSMQNGGGPACLRLRVVLTEKELMGINQKVLLDDLLFKRLNEWVDKHYRDHMTMKDLGDPDLLKENRTALDELTQFMQLGSVYPFQLERTGLR